MNLDSFDPCNPGCTDIDDDVDAQALLQASFVDSSSILAPIGSFRDTSCFAATLASTVNPMLKNFKQTANVSLLLLNTVGLEMALTMPTTLDTLSVVGRCDAGASSSNCSLVAGSLDTLDHYYLMLSYPGEPDTTRSNAIRSAIQLSVALSAYDSGFILFPILNRLIFNLRVQVQSRVRATNSLHGHQHPKAACTLTLLANINSISLSMSKAQQTSASHQALGVDKMIFIFSA